MNQGNLMFSADIEEDDEPEMVTYRVHLSERRISEEYRYGFVDVELPEDANRDEIHEAALACDSCYWDGEDYSDSECIDTEAADVERYEVV